MVSKSLRLSILQASLKAQCGERQRKDAAELVERARQELGEVHGLVQDLEVFAAGMISAQDGGEIWKFGKDLGAALARHNNVEPVGLERKDLFG